MSTSLSCFLMNWRTMIVVIFVLAMLLTPADAASMLLVAVPLTALYIGGILLHRFVLRRQCPVDKPKD